MIFSRIKNFIKEKQIGDIKMTVWKNFNKRWVIIIRKY